MELDLSRKEPFRKPFQSIGLEDAGILGYRNVALHGLFHNPRMREWLFRHNSKDGFESQMCQIKYGNCMACELYHVIKVYWNKYMQIGDAAYMESMNDRLRTLSERCYKGKPYNPCVHHVSTSNLLKDSQVIVLIHTLFASSSRRASRRMNKTRTHSSST